MKKVALISMLGAVLATTSFARPYIGLQLGMANISGAKTTIDTGIKRLALGYAVERFSRLTLKGEIGVTDGMTYDAGQISHYTDNHVQVHIGSSIDGLVGVGYRLGRVEWSVMGGVQSTKLATGAAASQDTLSKVQPLLSARLDYQFNPNVKLGIIINHTFGKSGDVYTYDPAAYAITLNHIPSITTFMVGVQLAI